MGRDPLQFHEREPRSVPSSCRATAVVEDVGVKVCIGIYNSFVVEKVWKAVISQVLMLIKTSTKLQPSRTKRVSGLVSALNLRL